MYKYSGSIPISKTSHCTVYLAVSGKKKANFGVWKLYVYPALTTLSGSFGALSVAKPEGISIANTKAFVDLK